jgi:hypothetical protein
LFARTTAPPASAESGSGAGLSVMGLNGRRRLGRSDRAKGGGIPEDRTPTRSRGIEHDGR